MKILFLLIPLSVFASDKLPKMKSGAWELSMSIPEMAMPIKSTYCIDDQSQNKLLQSSQEDMGSCETPNYSFEGNIFRSETTCLEGGRKATIQSTMIFSGDTSFTSDIKVISDEGSHSLKGSGKFTGPCPTGMKPGDVKVGGFSQENLEAMMRQLR